MTTNTDTNADIRIDNARVIDPASVFDDNRTLHISNGKINTTSDDAATAIDAKGLIACPGFVDLYARLREPGFTTKGNIASESRAALKAGFGTVFCSPDTKPVIDSTATVELIRQKTHAANAVRVMPIAALTAELAGERLSEMVTLYGAGCLILGHADKPLADTGVLLSAMEYAASFDLPIMITPKDPAIAGNGCVHGGSVATRLGLPGIPEAAETVALAKLIELCRSTQCRLHVSRLSSARAVDLIRNAKAEGLSITADVGIHHLFFSHEQLNGYDVNFHSTVPFRSLADRDALRQGVRDGTIDAVCSDHAPHDNDSKLAPFPSSGAGLSAFDVFLPLLLALPDLLNMRLIDVIAKVTTGPASIVARKPNSILPAQRDSVFTNDRYSIEEKSVADVILVDTNADADTTESQFLSKGLNSPLRDLTSLLALTGEDVSLKGRVVHNIVAGEIKELQHS